MGEQIANESKLPQQPAVDDLNQEMLYNLKLALEKGKNTLSNSQVTLAGLKTKTAGWQPQMVIRKSGNPPMALETAF